MAARSSGPPASSSSTRQSPRSTSRRARTQPAEPAPTTTKSTVSSNRTGVPYPGEKAGLGQAGEQIGDQILQVVAAPQGLPERELGVECFGAVLRQAFLGVPEADVELVLGERETEVRRGG